MSAKVGPEPLHRTSDIRGSVAQEPDLFALVMKELQKKVVSMLAHFSSQYWGCDERIVLQDTPNSCKVETLLSNNKNSYPFKYHVLDHTNRY